MLPLVSIRPFSFQAVNNRADQTWPEKKVGFTNFTIIALWLILHKFLMFDAAGVLLWFYFNEDFTNHTLNTVYLIVFFLFSGERHMYVCVHVWFGMNNEQHPFYIQKCHH